jgi:hypothetical protein
MKICCVHKRGDWKFLRSVGPYQVFGHQIILKLGSVISGTASHLFWTERAQGMGWATVKEVGRGAGAGWIPTLNHSLAGLFLLSTDERKLYKRTNIFSFEGF